MGAVEQIDRKFTEQEYFEILANSEMKYEFHDGILFAMAGGKRPHNKAKRNMFSALEAGKGGCELYDSDVAVYIEKINRYYFPDISALCGEEIFTDEGGIERILNPSLFIEVLSKGTEGFDRGEKFEHYKLLSSFREYITIDSRRHLVSTYYRKEKGDWSIGSYYRLDQTVEVITLGISVQMSTIYNGVVIEE